ncbi:SH3 domain-containing protein [Mycena belliarum]|uniref:SH3 domain-containing protein n=1 Tax=Mycena belliarum TaxID=1033014 RepID=A0AAD6XPZ3_9AGAR|nr:SH3 domain-containing protein [Mycena belliae]
MSEAALLAHVVSQVQSNVNFLVSQNYISESDASVFLAKLPNSSAPRSIPMPSPAAPLRSMNGSAASTVQARALWPYNEDGKDADDLSFSAGDIIEVVKEENADWWMGRFNGKQALFPSAYVEKIAAPPPNSPAPGRNMPPAFAGNGGAKPYKPFMAAHQGRDAPPPPGGGTNDLGLQQDPEQEKKKGKFGKYGNTMAHSAAGGVGFGAGAAIGGGLVRAIF